MMRLPTLAFVCCAAFGLTACTPFPELEDTQTAEVQAAAYPSLVPLEPLLARAQPAGPDPVETRDALDARLSALRARATALRGSVLSNAEKERLRAGLR